MSLRPSSLLLKSGVGGWDDLTNSSHLQISSDGVDYRLMIMSLSRTHFV